MRTCAVPLRATSVDEDKVSPDRRFAKGEVSRLNGRGRSMPPPACGLAAPRWTMAAGCQRPAKAHGSRMARLCSICRVRVPRLSRRDGLNAGRRLPPPRAMTGCARDRCKFAYHSSAALVKIKRARTTEKSAIASSGANVVTARDTIRAKTMIPCPLGKTGEG
jgi:hypothetical protein